MDKTAYVAEAYRQLKNAKYYTNLDAPIYMDNKPKIINILENIYRKGYIDQKQLQYLAGPTTARRRIFYLLPKIHKSKTLWPQYNMPEGRPIVSDVSSESYRISEYIDYFINPLACVHSSYIKNT
jgi:hypothetical protein